MEGVPELPGEDLRPSFFELYAQERLTVALRPALRYVLEILSVRRPSLLRLAERSDELFALISIFVEMNQLSKKNSTLSESFYGLRRSEDFHSPSTQKLTGRQILVSVLLTAILPYLKLKLDQLYINSRPSEDEHRADSRDIYSFEPSSSIFGIPLRLVEVASSRGLRALVILLRDRAFQKQCKGRFLQLFPAANALYETLIFAFNILYLFGHTRYFNPFLAAQRLVIRRVRGSEIVGSSLAQHQSDMRTGLVSALMTVGDKVVTGIKCVFIGGVFLIRFLEFYYAAESRLPRRSAYVPPPPERLLPLDDFDAESIKSNTVCPLCRRNRTNPAACANSGYVFCYPCIFSYIQEHGKCPVTGLEASIEDIIRVFDDQSI